MGKKASHYFETIIYHTKNNIIGQSRVFLEMEQISYGFPKNNNNNNNNVPNCLSDKFDF